MTRARPDRDDGRVAEPAGLGGRVADPVPRARRRQPRADGFEHAAPGGAAAADPGAARRHRHGSRGGARFGRHRGRQARRLRGVGRRQPHRHQARRRRRDRLERRHHQPHQVPALEPEHLHQPAPDREAGRPRAARPGDRRRSGDRTRRAGARAQRRRRLHAVGRVQLRGLDPDLRARGQGRLVHLGPHRGVRVRRARHQARQGGDHPRHPERRRRGAEGSRRGRHRAHRRRGEAGRHPRRQDHAEGRDPALSGGAPAARDLRREGRRRARHLAARAAGRLRAS